MTKETSKYEVYSLYPMGRKYTSVYSCENKCPECRTKCEFGVFSLNQIGKDVGA